MIPKELADQVRTEVEHLKEEQEKFLQTYRRLCVHHGGPDWHKEEIEVVVHRVRREVIPIMEQAGMEHAAVQALCAWAEKMLLHR